jgi:hypothetical protein
VGTARILAQDLGAVSVPDRRSYWLGW